MQSNTALRSVVAPGACAGLACVALLWACKKEPPTPNPVALAIAATDQYATRAKTTEAVMHLKVIQMGMASYATNERFTSRGAGAAATTGSFPKSAPRTPATVPCGTRAAPNPNDWNTDSWRAIDFSISDPHYYSYEFDADANSFTARAIGDLDCDGVLSTFERSGHLNAQGEVESPVELTIHNELE